MTTKTETIGDTVGGVTGTTLAINPGIVPIFYETVLWQGSVAVLGMTVLVLTVVHLTYVIRRDRK